MPSPILKPSEKRSDLEKLSARKRASLPVGKLLANNWETRNVGRQIGNCAKAVKAALELRDLEQARLLIEEGNFCNARLCNLCEWRRARAWRARLLQGIPDFAEHHPGHRALFLTLTVRNCQIGELATTIKDLHAGWDRMAKSRWFPTPYWFRRTEVTVNTGDNLKRGKKARKMSEIGPADPLTEGLEIAEDSVCENQGGGILPPTAHPHIHALLLVPPRYFTTDYIRQSRWRELWMEAARLDYAPVVDVRAVRTAPTPAQIKAEQKDVILEVAKYCAKAAEVANLGALVPEFHHQMRCHRLFAVSGGLRPWVRSGDITAEEMNDRKAVLTSGSPLCRILLRWNATAEAYDATPLA